MKKSLSLLFALSCAAAMAGPAQAAPKMNVDAITTGQLHVRAGPGPHHKSVHILPAGFPLVVGNCTRAWCQVYYSGTNGWAYMPMLAFRQGTSFAKDPNLGPFARHRYQRGRLEQTVYLMPQAERKAAGGGGLGKLTGSVFSLGKKGFMTATPMGGALTAASAVKGGIGGAGTMGQMSNGFGHGALLGQAGGMGNRTAPAIAGRNANAAGGWLNAVQRPSYNAAWQQQPWGRKK